MNKIGRFCALALLAACTLPGASGAYVLGDTPRPLLSADSLYLDTDDAIVASSASICDAFCTVDTYAGGEIPNVGTDEYSEAAFVACERDADGSLTIGSRLWELFFGEENEPTEAPVRKSLIVGGAVFGTRIKESRVTVTSPDEAGILHEGDKIISLDGRAISSINDIKEVLSASDGSPLHLTCKRGGKQTTLTIAPKKVGDNWRLGAVLREGAAGLGTITYIDPTTGEFGGLGHGISDPDTGEIVEMSGGSVTDVILGGVVKGEGGKPGELSGILTDRNAGEIYTNTDCGVFGKLTKIPSACTEVLPIAYRDEVKAGKATIISTLKNGKTMEYSIEIFDVKENATGTKCFKIRVTDPALLAISGGIVRGMSGSPIKQDGKLVGAVTHVMVADPTAGYGIFIENMLNAAQSQVQQKAA